MRINLIPFAGRVGTTSIAIATAAELNRCTDTIVDIAVSNQHQILQLLQYMGMPISEWHNGRCFNLHIRTQAGFDIHTVTPLTGGYSVGIYMPEEVNETWPDMDKFTFNVALLSTTYSSLACYTQSRMRDRFDACIVNEIPDTALTVGDVKSITDKPIIEVWEHDPAIQRTIDAGMFHSRRSKLDHIARPLVKAAFAKTNTTNEQEYNV